MSAIDVTPSMWDDPEKWDAEWARDWSAIERIFGKIEELKRSFDFVDLPKTYVYSLHVIINGLERFAFSLSKIIEAKYSENI